jgi:carbamoyltransferase
MNAGRTDFLKKEADLMYVLGVWDGHDAGAALVRDNEILYAADEERFTKRKHEMRFPYNAVRAALSYEGIKPGDIEHVAFTTTEFTKTLERVFPGMKESYYNFRRRKILKPRFAGFRHKLKYSMTQIGILPLCNQISSAVIRKQLAHLGFGTYKLHIVEHHTAHAATAAFTSPYKKALVVTMDGLGDGLSGSVSAFENGELARHISIKARDSLGIFFEQATNIIGMRELEDEGKLMAMADYSYPFEFEENPLKDFFTSTGTVIKAKYGPSKQFDILERIAWKTPREQFSYFVQQLFENVMTKFISNNIDRFGIPDVAMSGGVFSNVKANMMVRRLDNLKHWYIFPHMGDGGVALGAALYASNSISGSSNYKFSAYLGSSYDAADTEKALRGERAFVLQPESAHEHASHAAELIDAGNYILWFQGRMEFGPRALGNRSILASSGSESVKEKLNLYVKKREWFQPFAPSMLEEEASKVLDYDNKGNDKFMTMAYAVRENMRQITASTMHIDGSARPQLVGDENPMYKELLSSLKKRSGYGIALNTSFNIHGMPIVMSPQDAAEMMKITRTKYMFINGIFVTNRAGV